MITVDVEGEVDGEWTEEGEWGVNANGWISSGGTEFLKLVEGWGR